MTAFAMACVFTIGFLAGVLSLIALVCTLDAKSDTQTSIVIERTPVKKTEGEPILTPPFKTDILI